jgi:hypothetical protein
MANDKALLERIVLAAKEASGECRVCHCAGDSCALPEGDKCVWINPSRTLCSNPGCVIAASKAERKRVRRLGGSSKRTWKGRAA